MAINLSNKYPLQVLTSDPTGYPWGKPKNETAPGTRDGTPWEAQLAADIVGFLQACLSAGGLTPSNVPDKVGASQYLEGLRSDLRVGPSLRNWEICWGHDQEIQIQNSGASVAEFRGGAYDAATGYWLAVGGLSGGGTDTCWISRDDGRSWERFDTPNMAASIILEDVAFGGSGSSIACGNSANVYRNAQIANGNAWGGVATDGTPTLLRSVVYDPINTRYIVVGEKAGPDPYLATSDDATGSAWTERSVSLPAGFAGKRLGALATDGAGTVITAATTAHTKIAVSTDGGASWADSTTAISGVSQLCWAPDVDGGVFVALGSSEVWTSPDGDTWTQRSTGAIPLTVDPDTNFHSLASLGNAIVIAGQFNATGFAGGYPAVAYSLDVGVTWAIARVGVHTQGSTCVIDGAGRLVVGSQGAAARSGRL